jgi:hypothetical protein
MGSLSRVGPIDALNSIGLHMVEALRERTINMPDKVVVVVRPLVEVGVKEEVAKCSSRTSSNMAAVLGPGPRLVAVAVAAEHNLQVMRASRFT